MQVGNHFKTNAATSFIPNADKDFNNPNAFRQAAKAGEAIQQPIYALSQTPQSPVAETPRASNYFNSMMPQRHEPAPEKKSSVLGNALRGFAKGANPGLYEYEKANYDHGQQVKAQQAKAQEAEYQNQRTQAVQNTGKMAHLMREMTPEQRMEFASQFAQQNNMAPPNDPSEFSDDAIMQQMQQAQLAGWEMPQEQERKTMEDVNGVQRYVDTGEQVFAGVERQEERDLPTGMYWDEATQSAQWHPEYLEQENRAQGMTPYQQAQINMQREKMQQEQAAGGSLAERKFAYQQDFDDRQQSFRESAVNQKVIDRENKFKAQAKAQIPKLKTVLSTIQDAKKRSDWWNTGITSRLDPSSGGADLTAALDTIGANLAFRELGEMRANSPTGGALGSITERELDLLSSTMGSLKRAQSEGRLDEQLTNIEGVISNILGSIEADLETPSASYSEEEDSDEALLQRLGLQ